MTHLLKSGSFDAPQDIAPDSSWAHIRKDNRVILTLDAGGSSFRFTAIQGGSAITQTITFPTDGHDRDACLRRMIEGFRLTWDQCPIAPVALSFAFPGPADYPNGIIGDLANLPGFRGGVPLGPILANEFGIPAFINNDGDLFTLGEAIAGFLPAVNRSLDGAKSVKRFRNLIGITLGTGFGLGVVHEGKLFTGDNSLAGEGWLFRNRLDPETNVEETASIRGLRRIYSSLAGCGEREAPTPKEMEAIAIGSIPGNQKAAKEAYRKLGIAAGDAIAQAVTLIDGLVVIGGGIAKGHTLFWPSLISAMQGTFSGSGTTRTRLVQRVFDL